MTTQARDTLNLLRRLDAAVAASRDPIPAEYVPLLGQRSPSLSGGKRAGNVHDAGRSVTTRVAVPTRTPPGRPWASDRNGLPAADMAAWPAPPMLLTTDDAEALERWGAAAFVVARDARTTPEAYGYSRVFPKPVTVSGRPRVAVWRSAHTPATPHGSFLLATSAHVARQAVEAITPYVSESRNGRRLASEQSAYRAFADRQEAEISRTLAWASDPFVEDLLAGYDAATTPPPRATTATPYGFASAGPADSSRRGRGRA